MYNVIASSFFQKKHCSLPGIGSLDLVTRPAEADFVNTSIKAPVEKIVFTPSANDRNDFNEFSAISELMSKKLSGGCNVEITGVGIFSKDPASGNIYFSPVELDNAFTPPVTAERVIRQDAEHAILVGDKETTNTEMTDYFSDKTEVKQHWWIAALVLGIAGLGCLLFYIYQHGLNAFGNIAQP